MNRGSLQLSVRASTALVVVICSWLLVQSALAGGGGGFESGSDLPGGTEQLNGTADVTGRPDSTPREVTVVTTQGFYTGTHPGARDVADLLAFDAAGTVIYHNSTYDVYFDVDPVPGTRMTIEYVAARRLGGASCDTDSCSLNLVERLNLSTGAVTRIYDAVTPEYDTGRWHDVDRVNETHLVVADIVYDRVFMVDVRTGEIVWQWNASDHYPPTAGGGSGDWTHLNDVEVLDSGWIMVSLRNMDSVVFIDPAEGPVEGWTLGADNARGILNEQHNPDYIPPDRGGPAVLVSDSENNRVVEYHRVDGHWQLVWTWRDRRLQWPRDADRLPNGHTLVADSHGDRVLELGTDGSIVWAIEVGRPYDAERLGTGDGSETGFAAGSSPADFSADSGPVRAPPSGAQGAAGDGDLVVALKDALPGPLVNGLLFVAPPWFSFTDLIVAGVLVGDLLIWAGIEWHWSGWSIRRRVARILTRYG